MSKKILAALLAVLMVLTIVPMTAFAAGFDDTTGHWGKDAIDRWAQAGIFSGKGDGKFDPNGSMTRAEFAQMLVNMMGYTEKAENVFNDVPAGSWYEDAMLKLVAAGVLNGTGAGKADPNGKITREQTAVLLCRAFGIKPSANATLTFKDSASVSSWARDAVAALAERKMMNGVGNNTAAPKWNIDRASVAQLADNMITHYVTEDTTITGEVKGIVLVAGGATVTLSDATVEAPVVVAPKAEEVTVTLAGETTVESVAVAAENAAVTVADTATVGAVSVEAPSATAEIAGKVETVTVAEAAESAAVTVADTAEVGEVAVEAPSATAEIAGKVESVTVAEAAESAAVTVAKTAEVGTVSVEAPKATTEIAGKADSVTVAGTAESAKVNVPGTVGTVKTEAANTDVKVDGKADSVTVAGENAKVNVAGTVGTVSTEAANTNVSVSGTVSKVDVAEGADKANISTTGTAKIENVTTSAEDVKVSGTGSVGNVTANKGSADVTTPGTTVKNEGADNVTAGGKPVESGKEETTKPSTPSGGNSGGSTTPTPAPADVVAAPIEDHAASNPIPVANLGTVTVSGTQTAEKVYSVKITGRNIMNHSNANNTPGHWVGFGMPVAPDGTTYTYTVGQTTIGERTCESNGRNYQTVYFSENTEAAFKDAKYTVTVKDGDDVVATYNVSFDVTFWKATGVQVLANEAETAAAIAKLETPNAEGTVTPWAHKFAKGLGFDVTKNGTTLKLSGETTTGKLESTSTGAANADGYLTYVLQVGDSAIKSIKIGSDVAELDNLGMSGITLVVNKKIYTGSSKTFSAGSTTFSLCDANGRVQDEVIVTVDPTDCSITGMKKVIFKNGDTVVETRLGETGGTVTAPAVPASTESVYYTGKWIPVDGTAVAAGGSITVGENDVTYTAEYKTIGAQAIQQRPDAGPAAGDYTGGYDALYKAAGLGMTASNGECQIAIDASKLIKLESAQITALSHGSVLYYGLQFTKQAGATKLVFADTADGLKASGKTVISLTPDSTSDNGDVLNGEYIDYFSIAENKSGVLEFRQPATWTRYFMWMKDEEVLAVNKATIIRPAIEVPTVHITFDGSSVAGDIGYNQALTQEDYSKLTALLEAENPNYTVKGLKKDSDAVVVGTTAFTADTKLTVEWQAKANITVATGAIPASATGGASFGNHTAEEFQSLSALNFAKQASGTYTYKAEPTGFLYASKFDEYTTGDTGYYAVLKLEVPATLKNSAKIVINNNEKTLTDKDFDEDGNVTFIFKIDTLESATLSDKGVVISVDWDGDKGGNAAASYLVTFKNVKPSINEAKATDLTVDLNLKEDETGDVRMWKGNYYICYQVFKDAEEKELFPIQTGEILAAGKVGTDGVVAMYKLWTTGEDDDPNKDLTDANRVNALELPKSDLSKDDPDYKHHVGMTFKMDTEARMETWLFVDKDGKVYKAVFDDIKSIPKDGPATGCSTEG